MAVLDRYRALIAERALKPDAAQADAAAKLDALARALKNYRLGRRFFFAKRETPRGLYLWGDVGRGKSMLMDLFFENAQIAAKTRVHFNAFMVDTHARIFAERERGEHDDPIPPVAEAIAAKAALLCFDEFQVSDVADAMILGRLFEHLFTMGVVIVATSNTAPTRLYEGGLNRQLFLPFIALIEKKLEVLNLNGTVDYRLHRMRGMNTYITPLDAEADRTMDEDWQALTENAESETVDLHVLGRTIVVPRAANGVARFEFADLCAKPLAAADYLAIAHAFHTVMIDHVPVMRNRDEARRFVLLIDTLYDEGVKFVCSAEAAPDALYATGDGADAFRRTASRLAEMQSADYLTRGHTVEHQRADVD
ncbi:MAG TPA: cell division protein ZapE [Rhizomicrobium sp.]|nr:cell division protein ZapE [Rhizomicrobium sp.]